MAIDVDRYLLGAPINLFQPHVILPAQYFLPAKKLAPEQRLMMAVLDDAVRCVEKYRVPTDAHSRRLFREAQQWLLAAEPHWPYSFERICAVLDLDASAVRHHLRLAPEQDPVAVGSAATIRPHTPQTRSNRTARATRSDLRTPHVATPAERSRA